MKRKVLLFMMMMILAVTAAACGNKVVENETAVETPEAPVEEGQNAALEENQMPETEDDGAEFAYTEDEAAGVEEKTDEAHNENVTQQQIEKFAGKVKDAVANKDLETLSGMCDYPVYVDGGEVVDAEAFKKLDAAKLFTDTLLKEIADTDISSLEIFGAGIEMGETTSIFMNDINGELKITSITTE